MHHLEGKTVNILADGNVIKNKVVVNGSVSLTQPASRVIVGLAYRSTAKNMPLSVASTAVDNKVKRITALALRVRRARGIMAGTALDALYAIKPRGGEFYGEANKLKDGTFILAVEPTWNLDVSSYIVQDDPLPITILGYTTEAEIGDDPD